VAAGVGQIGHVGVEILAAAGAVVLGVKHDEVTGPSGEGIAQVVKSASELMIAVGAMATARTGPVLAIPALTADLGLGQILDAAGALGGVGSVFAGSGHENAPGRKRPTRNYARRWRFVHKICPVTLL